MNIRVEANKAKHEGNSDYGKNRKLTMMILQVQLMCYHLRLLMLMEIPQMI
jgi:hypothetical protein